VSPIPNKNASPTVKSVASLENNFVLSLGLSSSGNKKSYLLDSNSIFLYRDLLSGWSDLLNLF
jgi:hypothetical protein